MKKKMKRRFITIELSQDMTDEQEKRFKESVADRINDLRFKDNRGLLIIPKVALKTKFEGDSDIVVVNSKIHIQ